MIAPTRRIVIAYLAGTFLLGAIAGGALGYGYGRRPVFRSFDRDEMRTKFCDRLVTDLDLSASQREQLDPLVRENMEEFEAAHRDHFRQIEDLMKQQRERIAVILDPAQRQKFEKIEKEREERMPKRNGGKPAGKSDKSQR